MTEILIKLRSLPDSGAAVGWAGGHSLTVDRPSGVAGGSGLGFNGGQLLALAIGGCFCNDLHYVASAQGVELGALSVNVILTLAGEPLLVTSARLEVSATAVSASADINAIIAEAKANSTVGNSIIRGIPVEVTSPKAASR